MGKLAIDKETTKLWRLQTSEKYTTKKMGDTSFEVFTKCLKLKAFVDVQGFIISSSSDDYDKIIFYKLRNYCNLLQSCHLGV